MKRPYNPLDHYTSRPASTASSPSATPSGPAQRVPFAPVQHRKEALEDNYVDFAESVIDSLNKRCLQDRRIKTITSSKLRNLFELFADAYNQCLRQEGDELTEAQISALRSARVRIVYECGRDNAVKQFVEESHMLGFLLSIDKSKAALIRYYHYIEALVAYGRFYGLTKDEK